MSLPRDPREKHFKEYGRLLASVSCGLVITFTSSWTDNTTYCSCEDGTLTVKAGILHHRIASFGYVVTEDPLPGK